MPVTISGTSGLAGVNGSASTPAVQGEDTNTGVFFPAADTVAVATGGSERMRVDSSGNLGLGVTPSAWLSTVRAIQLGTGGSISNWTGSGGHLILGANYYDAGAGVDRYINTAAASKFVIDTGSFGWSTAPSGTAGNAITFTERARIDSSGNLLVGTTSAFASGFSNGSAQVQRGGAGPALFLRNNLATAGKFWQVGPDNSGNALIVYNQSGTGVYITDGGTGWTANSDERLKTTLVPFEDAVGKVCSLRAGTGRYLTDEEDVSRSFLIAQDVQAVLPEAVDVQGDEQGTLGLRYTDVVPLLVAALKELKAEVDSLKAQLEAAQ
jgi:hypothetical protein